MTGRKIKFFDIKDPPEMMDFSSGIPGTFHKWGTYQGDSIALVEDNTGRVRVTIPEFVKFDEYYHKKK